MRLPTRWAAAAVLVALGIGLLSAAGTVSAAAKIRTVSPSGANSGDCSSSACKTISYAVSQASAGDTIVVSAGLYSESVTIDKTLALRSNGAVIDASGHDNGILITGEAAKGSVVSGFTVRDATMEGILAMQTTGVSILDNTVTQNDRGVSAASPVGECAPQGAVPGDCGEAIHLWSVSYSLVSGNTVMDNDGGILLTDETGPTFGNKIVGNTINNTGEDCGIVLASHVLHIGSPVSPDMGGVYNNTVSGNTVLSTGPNGAGVGLFAAPPGASTYNNTVTGNTLSGTGAEGVGIHSHAPFQNVNGNVITNNTISNSGPDLAAGSDGPTGIVVFADVGAGAFPITHETIESNTISDNDIGIFVKGVKGQLDLQSNTMASSVKTALQVVEVTPPSGGPGGPSQGGQGGPITGPITPPNTGDGGLVGSSSNASGLAAFGLLVGVLAIGFLGAARAGQREL